MNAKSRRPKPRDGAISSLNAAIDAMNLVKEALSMTPAMAVAGLVSVVLTMTRDSMINKADYINLGLTCANACGALARGFEGRRTDRLNHSVLEAIEELTADVTEIQRNIVKRRKQTTISRLFHAKNDKEAIATWRLDLNRIIHTFDTELAINTHNTVVDVRDDVANVHTAVSELQRDTKEIRNLVSDIHNNLLKSKEKSDDRQQLATQVSVPCESPPPAPGVCFGREKSVDQVVCLAENLGPLALIGTGGIGKTPIALIVLHHDRIQQGFGENCRSIRCDKFPASCAHFLSRLSSVVGAGVGDPEDLAPLRPFLSSGKLSTREALGIYEQHNHVSRQADCRKYLARLLHEEKLFEVTEEAALRAINLLSGGEDPVTICQCHRVLGDICSHRGDMRRAINYFEKALGIASSFAWRAQQFWILCSLAQLHFIEGRFDDARVHIERATSHTIDSAYLLGRVTRLRAHFWYKQQKFVEAKSEVLHAAEIFGKLAATKDVQECRKLLQDIEAEVNPATSYNSGLDGEIECGVAYHLY